MKILYNNQDGKIFYVVLDKDWFMFIHSTNIPLTEIEIDEINPDNKTICVDLRKTNNRFDINGLKKYYISNGDIYERENWEEFVEDTF